MKQLFFTVLLAQAPPITGPGMHWYKDQWYDMENEFQQNSGEDWHYDLIPYLEDGVLDGYAGIGFSTIVNDNGNFNCFTCGVGTPDQLHLERTGYEKGCYYPKIAEMDKQGNVEWYQIYTKGIGYFRAGVQLDDESGYVAVGILTFDGANGIPYNPGIHDQGFPLDLCEGGADPYYNLLYVVKTDANGNLIKDAVYGMAIPSEAHLQGSQGYGIIQDIEDHNLIITGFAFESGQKKAYVMKINKSDLSVAWRKTIISAGSYESHGTCLVEHDNFYYVAGTKDYDLGVPGHGKINIVKLSSSGTEIATFEINEATTGDTDIDDHFYDNCSAADYPISTCAAYNMVINNGDLLVAAQVKRADAIQGLRAEALGKVYRINLSGSMSWEKTILAAEAGANQLLTYDLKIGLTNTFDGGYAITSSMHDYDLFGTCVAATINYYPGYSYTFPYDQTRSWNANAYIAKFTADDVMQWRSTYPVTNGYGTYFPNDIKRMECLYEIVEADDHGFVVGGNNSKNFDDDMVIKIYNDCSIYTTYNTAGGDIDVVGTQHYYGSGNLWENNKRVRGIIQINSGATLTINNNAVIEFADSKSANRPTYIIVKRGGRLIVEGGAKLTSTSGCNVMWEGIYVEGKYGTAHPTPVVFMNAGYTNANHGFVWLKTGATIENARRGVSLGLPEEMGSFPNYGGGIIIADDANFINNSYDIYFHPFNKNNISFIRHCNLITNAALKDEIEVPVAHVNMINVDNVTLRGNYFENTLSPLIYPGIDKTEGVHGFVSSFTVNDNPNGFGLLGATGSDPNIFKKLYYGVYAFQGPLVSDNVIIDGNTFEHNNRGVYLGSTALAEVNRNTFTILASPKINYGLYIDGSTGYGVEENTFNGPGANVSNSPTGLIVNQSGSSNNLVYRNTFNNLKFALKAQNNNGAGTGSTSTGLVLKCITFEDNGKDISVLSGTAIGKINENQGTCLPEADPLHLTSPANNLFTDPTVSTGQLFSSADVPYILYTFHEDIFPALPEFAAPSLWSSSYDPAPVGIDNTGCSSESFNENEFLSYCPTNFTTGGGGSGRMANPNTDHSIQIKTFPSFNPYKYAKADGTGYTEFIDEINRNMLMSYYMENDYTDSLVAMLEGDESLLAQTIQAGIAVDSGDYTEAELIVEHIDAVATADAEGYSAELQNISVTLSSDTLTWELINETDLNIIKDIALQDDRKGIQAKLILELTSNINYEEPIYDLDDEVTEDELRQIQTTYPPSESNTINIYPHPVSNNSIVEVNLEYLTGNDRFIITDIRGKIVTQFSIEENISYFKLSNTFLQPGVYIGYVQCNGCKQLSKQIIVVK